MGAFLLKILLNKWFIIVVVGLTLVFGYGLYQHRRGKLECALEYEKAVKEGVVKRMQEDEKVRAKGTRFFIKLRESEDEPIDPEREACHWSHPLDESCFSE